MLKHRTSDGPAEIPWGSTLIQEMPSARHRILDGPFGRHRYR
jgi:hypothetical protein